LNSSHPGFASKLIASAQHAASEFTPVRGGVLQRKCACGGSAGMAGECEECGNQGLSLQRSTRNSELETRNSGGVPPIVHEVLRSPGQPLDPETRAFMEPHFGHDFGNVRVHADAAAAESARAVNALAYTVGCHVVLGARQSSPENRRGQFTLAHELAHVVQQSQTSDRADINGVESTRHEREADAAAWGIVSGQSPDVSERTSQPHLQKIDLTPDSLAKDDLDPKTAVASDQYVDNNIADAGLREEPGPGWKPNFVALTIKYADGSILDIPLNFLRVPTPPGATRLTRYRTHPASGKIVPVTWRGTSQELMSTPDIPQGSVIFSRDITPNIMVDYDIALFRRAAVFSGDMAQIWAAALMVRGAIQIFSAAQAAAISAAGRGGLATGGAAAARAAAIREMERQALEAEQKALIAELRAAGVSFTEKEIVQIIRSAAGKVVWLEKGSAQAGLEHIMTGHASQFAKLGVNGEQNVVKLIVETLKTKTPISVDATGGQVFKVIMGGAEREMKIVVGSNGFVVTAYPL
jgi:hypothetical protein